MITIAPSILAADFLELKRDLQSFEGLKNIWFHLDVMDNHFVPNLTFGSTVLKNISKVTEHKLDAHFMVENIQLYIEDFKDMNLHNFTYHYEAESNHLEVIKNIKANYPSAGISLKPGTDVSVLTDEILSAVDLVLIMSVEPGFGGQSFMENSLDKIKHLNSVKEKFNFQIQIDGGINETTSKLALNVGCDNLVAGSYIFKADQSDYATKVASLR
jgi:ribulose-phosphate 3-epimerase